MTWTVSVTIYTEDQRMELDPIYQRPRGTIMGVNLPANKGGYGPDTVLGLLDVSGIPDQISLNRLRVFLLQDWRLLDVRLVTAWRDVEVVFDDLPANVKRKLLDRGVKRAAITAAAFLASTKIKRHGRRLTGSDL